MRVRYAMVDIPSYQAECDLTDKQAHSLYSKLKEDIHCVWAELISEEEDSYLDVIDGFDHKDAYVMYEAEQQVKAVAKELFG